jgi:hypothetical protein
LKIAAGCPCGVTALPLGPHGAVSLATFQSRAARD